MTIINSVYSPANIYPNAVSLTSGHVQKNAYENKLQAWNTVQLALMDLREATLTLKNATELSLKPALENFVAAYNAFKEVQLSVTKYKGAQSANNGVLIGDTMLLQIERQLRNSLLTTTATPGTINSLGQTGISLNANGKYGINQSKLDDAVNNKANEIIGFLKGDGQSTGVVTKMEQALNNALRRDGLIDGAVYTLNKQIQYADRNTMQSSWRTEQQRNREKSAMVHTNMYTTTSWKHEQLLQNLFGQQAMPLSSGVYGAKFHR